MNWVELILWS